MNPKCSHCGCELVPENTNESETICDDCFDDCNYDDEYDDDEEDE